MNPSDFESALIGLLDGEISPEDFAELKVYLADSADARMRYLDFAELHNLLELELSARPVIQPGATEVISVERIVARQQRKTLRWSAVAAAALVMLMGILLRLVLTPEPEAVFSYRTTQDTILSVSHSTTGEETPAPGALVIGSRLVLDQGVVELTLDSGVVSIIEAPADLTLEADDRIQLAQGIAWFEVPKGAEGFQVQTPDVLVTDLGTEFGVISTDAALDEVHVFQGKVRVENLNGLKRSEILNAGNARQIGPAGRLKSIPGRSREFPTTLPASLPHVHLSFDSIEDGQLTVSGSHPDVSGITARLIESTSTPLVPGRRGQALSLSGRGDFVLTDWPGISGGAPRSVACWIRTPAEGGTAAIAGWGSIRNNGRWKLHIVEDGPEQGRVAQATGGAFGYATKGASVDDGQWHHIAVVYYGRLRQDGKPDLAIFVDGERQESALRSERSAPLPEVNTITDAKDSMPLLVGKPTTTHRGSYHGEVDELYVVEGALSDESIANLAAGKALNEGQ